VENTNEALVQKPTPMGLLLGALNLQLVGDVVELVKTLQTMILQQNTMH